MNNFSKKNKTDSYVQLDEHKYKKEVLNYLKENGPSTRQKIAEFLNTDASNLSAAFSILEDEGIIHQAGEVKNESTKRMNTLYSLESNPNYVKKISSLELLKNENSSLKRRCEQLQSAMDKQSNEIFRLSLLLDDQQILEEKIQQLKNEIENLKIREAKIIAFAKSREKKQ